MLLPYTHYHNAGDVLINRIQARCLREHSRLLVVDFRVPEQFLAGLRIADSERLSKLNSSAWLAVIGAALEACFFRRRTVTVFLTPGHIMGHRPRVPRSGILALCVLAIGRLFGVRSARLGLSLGVLAPPRARLERLLASVMSAYGVRDLGSMAVARELGFRSATMFPDYALLASPEDLANSSDRAAGLPNVSRRRTVMLSFRADAQVGERRVVYDSNFTRCIVEVTETLAAAGVDLPVVSYQVLEDADFSRAICSQLGARESSRESVADLSRLEDAYRTYRSVRFVLSNRLHVVLLSWLAGTPAAFLGDPAGHSKIIDVFTDAGLSEFILDCANPEVASAGVLRALDATEVGLSRFSDYRLRNKLVAESVFGDLFDHNLDKRIGKDSPSVSSRSVEVP